MKQELGESASVNRYRDWGIFKYWFRGVETNAPWVNNIYLITCGQVPEWLNLEHPKLKLINHKDYIPKEYLPTFNSNVIELFLCRIPELSEKFVLFNDDVFVINNIAEEDFFKGNIPVDQYMENAITNLKYDNKFFHILANDIGIVNEKVNKKFKIKKRYSIKYGLKRNFINMLCSLWPNFMGFYNPHLALPHLKSDFTNLWTTDEEKMLKTARNRFRGYDDINHWVFRYLRLAKGNFYPSNIKGTYVSVENKNDELRKQFEISKNKMICVNDDKEVDFCVAQKDLIEIFEKRFPNKSSFEK